MIPFRINSMIHPLTSQQEKLLPVVREHMERDSSDPLLIEGVSGVGKSTLVQEAAKKAGVSTLEIGEYESKESYEKRLYLEAVAVVDHRDAEWSGEIIANIRNKVKSIILLAHPQMPKEADFLGPVFHQSELSRVGVKVRVTKLSPMSSDEAELVSARLDQSKNNAHRQLVKQYSLGIVGLINMLLCTEHLDETKARCIAVAKIWQILHCAARYHHPPSERAKVILDYQKLHGDICQELDARSRYGRTFESEFEDILCSDTQWPLPKHNETIDIYKEMIREGGCLSVLMFVPDIPPESLSALIQYDADRSAVVGGRIFSDGGPCGLARVAVITHDPVAYEKSIESSARHHYFDSWIDGKNESREIPEDLPHPGAHPMVFYTPAHGGSHIIDNPSAPYLVETLLQGQGIPYFARYHMENKRVDMLVERKKITYSKTNYS